MDRLEAEEEGVSSRQVTDGVCFSEACTWVDSSGCYIKEL